MAPFFNDGPLGDSVRPKAKESEAPRHEKSLSKRAQATSHGSDDSEVEKGPPYDLDQPAGVEDELPKTLSEKQRLRWRGIEYAIQPHTDEGGDAYFLGDAHEGITCATEWEIPNPGPYLRYIKHISKSFHHLAYLGHWMEVTAAPPKWKYIKHYPGNRSERSQKTRACVIDYTDGNAAQTRHHNDAENLIDDLQAAPQTSTRAQTRLIVVEDLCRDVVEGLGAFYDVDPMFFLSHIGDYLFHNTRDPWVELPNLDLDNRQQPHFHLQYLRARYFATEKEFQDAEEDSGKFNVLRRLDSDRSRKRLQDGLLDRPGASVTLTRAKTSLWIKPRKQGDPVTAILLVDPTVKFGQPLWGGYRPFQGVPSMQTWRNDEAGTVDAPKQINLFDDAVYYCSRMSSEDVKRIHRNPKYVAFPMYRLVLADWLTVLKYMTTMLGKIEWEFEKPHWGKSVDNIDAVLRKLSPWRRNAGYYQTMITESIARLFHPEIRAPYHASDDSMDGDMPVLNAQFRHADNSDTGSLWVDFHNVKRQMNESQARIKSIELMATNAINTEESRRAVKQNKNLARVTLLATIFIPLNLTSSFLSISNEFSVQQPTFWLFFAIGVPLTILVMLVLYLTHPKRIEAFLKVEWVAKLWRKKTPQSGDGSRVNSSRRNMERSNTKPWLIYSPTTWTKTK